MSYEVSITRRAQKQLDDIAEPHRTRLRTQIAALSDEPRPPNCLKMTNSSYWRLKVGDYRVIYEIRDAQLIVTVIEAGHRREIYR